MRHAVLAFILAVSLMLSLGTVAVAGEVAFSPAQGSPTDSFKFTGFGFTPGAKIYMSATTPDGQELVPPGPDGGPAFLVVGDDGHFNLDLVPARDLPVVMNGTWTINFKDDSNGELLTAKIEISS